MEQSKLALSDVKLQASTQQEQSKPDITSIFGSVAKPGVKAGFGGPQAPVIDYDALLEQENKKLGKSQHKATVQEN